MPYNKSSKSSIVWKFFEKFKDDGREKSKCKLCNHTANYHNNTTNLKDHLKRKHPLQLGELENQTVPQETGNINRATSANESQRALPSSENDEAPLAPPAKKHRQLLLYAASQKEITELLIQAVRARPALWDKRQRNYHNRIQANKYWTEVGEELDSPRDAVQKRWKGLRDVFRKELKKTPKSGATGPDFFNSKWGHFESMLFLIDKPTPGEYAGNISMNESSLSSPGNSSRDSESPSELLAPTDRPSRRSSDIGFGRNTSAAREMKRKKFDHRNIEEQPKVVRQSRRHSTEDDDYNFLMSLLPEMRKMPSLQKYRLRLKIQELFIQFMTDIERSNAVQDMMMPEEPASCDVPWTSKEVTSFNAPTADSDIAPCNARPTSNITAVYSSQSLTDFYKIETMSDNE